jgi:hypothetical protein
MLCDIDCIKQGYLLALKVSIFNVGMSIIISIYLIVKHLHNFNRPMFQSKIIGIDHIIEIVILMMAPFYGINSLVSMEYPVLVYP